MDKAITRELSALIVADTGRSGTGVLFCPPGDENAYLLTCAHIFDGCGSFALHYLAPINPDTDEYLESKIELQADCVVVHPNYSETLAAGRTAPADAAALCFKRPEGITENAIVFDESRRNMRVYGYGFPQTYSQNTKLLFDLQYFLAEITASPPGEEQFIMEMLRPIINLADRIPELEGFSGTPLFIESENDLKVCGLVCAANKTNAEYNALRGVKISALRDLLVMNGYPLPETALAHTRDAGEVAPVEPGNLPVKAGDSAELPSAGEFVVDSIRQQFQLAMVSMLELQMAKAIEICVKAVATAPDTAETHGDLQKIYQLLAHCYVAVDDREAWEAVVSKFDPAKSYMEKARFFWGVKRYDEAHEQITLALNERPCGIQEKVYARLIDIYREETPDPQSMLALLDDECRFVLKPDSKELEINMYQLYGYTFGDRFKLHDKAIRLINRAYQISGNEMALEMLSIAYYLYAMRKVDALEQPFDPMLIDREALYKARCCILILLEKADDLLIQGILKRNGIIIYNIFFFCNDAYRVHTLYRKVMEYHGHSDELAKELSDKYLCLQVASGKPDEEAMAHLAQADREYYNCVAACQTILCDFDKLVYDSALEKELLAKISVLEALQTKAAPVRQSIISSMIMNLLAYGRMAFGWTVENALNVQLASLEKTCHIPKQIETMKRLAYEATHDFSEAEALYLRQAQESRLPEDWSELISFYVRRRLYDKAEGVYQRLLDNPSLDMNREPEYLLRGYLDFCLRNMRNPMPAIHYYQKFKDEMLDKPIKEFIYADLCRAVNNHNKPDENIRLIRGFRDEGLINETDFLHRAVLCLMANARFTEAQAYCAKLPPKDYTEPEIHLTSIIQRRALTPAPLAHDFSRQILSELSRYQQSLPVTNEAHTLLKLLSVERVCAVDAYCLALLAHENRLNELQNFEAVYLTHTVVFRLIRGCVFGQDELMRNLLLFIETSDNIHPQSPSFENIGIARVDDKYWSEPMLAVALAAELKCPAIIGDLVDYQSTSAHPHCVIRYGWYRAGSSY